jgi:hypothetical protein
MLHKIRIALAITLLALAAVSVVDSASAVIYRATTSVGLRTGPEENDDEHAEQDPYRIRPEPLGCGGRIGRR